jgi:hypothetical protein
MQKTVPGGIGLFDEGKTMKGNRHLRDPEEMVSESGDMYTILTFEESPA